MGEKRLDLHQFSRGKSEQKKNKMIHIKGRMKLL